MTILSIGIHWTQYGGGEGEGTEVKMRNFAQIIAEDKLNRSILEIHLVKNATANSNEAAKVKF